MDPPGRRASLRGGLKTERQRAASSPVPRWPPGALWSLRSPPWPRGTCGARFGVVNLSSTRLAAPRRDIAGNRDPWVVLRGCEGPRSGAKVASDPVAPSRFLRLLLYLVDGVLLPSRHPTMPRLLVTRSGLRLRPVGSRIDRGTLPRITPVPVLPGILTSIARGVQGVRSPKIIAGLKMRYFFPVSDGSSTINDDEGTVLSGPDVAMIEAAVIAGELAQDGERYNGHVVYVTGIDRVPVVTAFMSLRRAPTENIALTMLARDGIAAIWRLHMAAADAHQTGHPIAAASILEIAEAAEEAWLRAEGVREFAV